MLSNDGENKDKVKSTRRKFHNNFDKRFQDLASLVLKGEPLMQEVLTDNTGANKNQTSPNLMFGDEDEVFTFLYMIYRIKDSP